MDTLFPIAPVLPAGFAYTSQFLTSAEEQHLLTCIQKIELHPFKFQGFEAKRRVASFGYDYSFDKNALTKGKLIPEEFNWVVKKVGAHLGIAPNDFAEVLITEYPVGSVINWHRDAFPFELIAGISLHADCIFRLRPYEKAKQTRHATISLPVKRGSLYVMEGPARTEWQHSIAPVKDIRYSITLRTLKHRL